MNITNKRRLIAVFTGALLFYLFSTQYQLEVFPKYEDVPAGDLPITSPQTSLIQVIPEKEYHTVGETITIKITSRDEENNKTEIGGDVYSVRLWSGQPSMSMGVELTDHNDGTYTGSVLLRWTGTVNIECRLLVTSKASKLFEMYHERDYYIKEWTKAAPFKRGNTQIFMPCSDSPLDKDDCDVSQYNGMDPWFCQKPNNMTCQDYHFDAMSVKSPPEARHIFPAEIKSKVTWDKPLKSVLITVTGEMDLNKAEGRPRSESFPTRDDLCEPHVQRKKFSGYFHYETWRSHDCATKSFSSTMICSCLHNKTVLLYGDSNTRLFSEQLITLTTGERFNWAPHQTKWRHPALNSSVEYYPLGHGLGNFPKSTFSLYSMEQVLTPRPDADVIIISIWAHFTFLSEQSLTNKFLKIREMLEKWSSVYPHVKIFLRSPHFRETQSVETHVLRFNNWNGNRAYKLMTSVFEGSKMYLINMQEMVVAFGGIYNIHPHEAILQESVNIVLSIYCDT